MHVTRQSRHGGIVGARMSRGKYAILYNIDRPALAWFRDRIILASSNSQRVGGPGATAARRGSVS